MCAVIFDCLISSNARNSRCLFIICVIVYNLCYCCYAETSFSAVQIRHSKVYGNPIAPSFYSILLDVNYSLDCYCYFCTVLFACSQGLSTKPFHNLLFYLLFSRFTKALMIGPTQNPNTNIHLSFIFFLLFSYHSPHKSKVFRNLVHTARYWALQVSRNSIILEFINVFLTLVYVYLFIY